MKPNQTISKALALMLGGLLTLPLFASAARPSATGQALNGGSLVRHIVAFKFAAKVTAEQKQHVVAEFLAMKRQIPSIVSIESGLNNSPEELDKGFTHVFIVTFQTTEERDDYVYNNPVHAIFKTQVGPLLDGGSAGVIVLDFNTKELIL